MVKKKKLEKICCEICGEKEKSVLHKHHIVERTEVHTNNHDYNLAVICSNCHNKTHAGLIKIIGLYPSTKPPYGRTLIYEEYGKSNCPGIDSAYYVPVPKAMRVYYGIECKDEDKSSD